jgi:NitT/TauT family transport system substrate-binding protein
MARERSLFGLILIAAVFLMASSVISAEKVRFASHSKSNSYFVLPVLAAMEKGYWKAEGVEAEWFPFGSSTTMVRAVAAGGLDMGTLSPTSTIIAISRGVPMVIVADARITYGFGIWVLTDSPLKKPTDLKGKRVGVTRFGGSPHRLAKIAIKNLGIEKEVKFVALGRGGAATAAFRAKAVEGVARDNLTMGPLKAMGEARLLVDMRKYAPNASKLVGATIYATKSFLAAKPEVIKKVVKGFMLGGDFVIKNKAWAIEKLKSQWNFNDAGANEIYSQLSYGPGSNVRPERLQTALDFIKEQQMVKKDQLPTLDSLYAKQFAQ